MLGAIVGDVIGSVYEGAATKDKAFALFPSGARFTDDTVLTVAVADAILHGKDFGATIAAYARRHPNRGYGASFYVWMMFLGTEPYNSFGNGSAMRVSPAAYAHETEDEVLELAKRSAECTHNHPEGIKGAQATALAVYLARIGVAKEDIRSAISGRFGYNLARTIDAIRPGYAPDVTSPGSVPEAIIAFLDAEDFEDAVRNAVSLGGDADTQAAIAGAIAEPFYGGVPQHLLDRFWPMLPEAFQHVIREFSLRFATPTPVP